LFQPISAISARHHGCRRPRCEWVGRNTLLLALDLRWLAVELPALPTRNRRNLLIGIVAAALMESIARWRLGGGQNRRVEIATRTWSSVGEWCLAEL